jgi:hypothetical protein
MPIKPPDAIALNDLYPLNELVTLYPKVLTINSLRWHLRHRHKNGLDAACISSLRRDLPISKSRFERWLATQTDDVRLG